MFGSSGCAFANELSLAAHCQRRDVAAVLASRIWLKHGEGAGIRTQDRRIKSCAGHVGSRPVKAAFENRLAHHRRPEQFHAVVCRSGRSGAGAGRSGDVHVRVGRSRPSESATGRDGRATHAGFVPMMPLGGRGPGLDNLVPVEFVHPQIFSQSHRTGAQSTLPLTLDVVDIEIIKCGSRYRDLSSCVYRLSTSIQRKRSRSRGR